MVLRLGFPSQPINKSYIHDIKLKKVDNITDDIKICKASKAKGNKDGKKACKILLYT